MVISLRNSTASLLVTLCVSANAETIYSNLRDIVIPTDFTGATVTVGDGSGGSVNPFFGGVGVANDGLFQPIRVDTELNGVDNLDSIRNLALGSLINASQLFATGSGGSQDHMGISSTQFHAGQEGFIGFKTGAGNYGWMRVVFTGNTAGAVIKDWAYETGGTAINVGRIQQGAASGGAQLVTLSPGSGESFTLGSQLANNGGNINSVLKTGAGTTTLSGTHTYTGSTTVSAGSLVVNGNISSNSLTTVESGATLSGSGTAGAVTILSGGSINPGNSPGNLNLTGNLTLAGTYIWELAALSTASPGVNFDTITLEAGNANIVGATLGLNLGDNAPSDDAFWQIDQTWVGILNNTGAGSLTGMFAAIDNSAWSNLGTFSTSNSGNDVNLVWTAVPEPRAALLGGLGLLVLLLRCRSAGS